MSFYSEMRLYAAILSLRPMFETMGMAQGTLDDVNSHLQGGIDIATESLQRLPVRMLDSYWHLRDKDYGSADALLDHLHDLHSQFYDCYKNVVLQYGIPPHNLLWPLVDSRNPLATPPELRSTTPQHILDLYPRLSNGLRRVHAQIALVRDVTQRYKLNLSILYQQFVTNITANDIGNNNPHDMDQDVVDAALELAKIVGSKQTPLHANPIFICEIARFWRTLGGKRDRIAVQPVYEWYTGRALTVAE